MAEHGALNVLGPIARRVTSHPNRARDLSLSCASARAFRGRAAGHASPCTAEA